MDTFSNKTTFYIVGLASFAVLSQWGFWDKDIFALGLNTSLVGFGFWFLLLRQRQFKLSKKDFAWLTPLWLVIFSFSLFENPWLKLVSAIVLPFATGAIYSFRQISARDDAYWGSALLGKLASEVLRPFQYLTEARQSLLSAFSGALRITEHGVWKRVFQGLGLLIPIGSIALILLSSADASFLIFITELLTSFWELVNFIVFVKVVTIFIISVIFMAMLGAWQGKHAHRAFAATERKLDDIVIGIVVVGILIIYISFLYFQIEYLAVTNLPIEFVATEKIVKSGFWQLFFLSILNVIMFFIVYKNTSQSVQRLLTAFILASCLVLLSACWRMGLYVYWYGLSYEKFFASYTAVYAVLIFVFLVSSTFSRQRRNVFKFIAFSCLWFYAIAAITPIERVIFNTNIYLSERDNSRVNLLHLTFLSVDVLNDAEQYLSRGKLDPVIWHKWIIKKRYRECQGHWYESNLSRSINCEGVQNLNSESGWIKPD